MKSENYLDCIRGHLDSVNDATLIRVLSACEVAKLSGLSVRSDLRFATDAFAVDRQSGIAAQALTRSQKIDQVIENIKSIRRQDGDLVYLDRQGFYQIALTTGVILSNTTIEKKREAKPKTKEIFGLINKGDIALGRSDSDEIKVVFESYVDWELHLMGLAFDRELEKIISLKNQGHTLINTSAGRVIDCDDSDNDFKVDALSIMMDSSLLKALITDYGVAEIIDHDTESWISNAAEPLTEKTLRRMEDIICRNRSANYHERCDFHKKINFEVLSGHVEATFNQLIDSCAKQLETQLKSNVTQDDQDSDQPTQGQ